MQPLPPGYWGEKKAKAAQTQQSPLAEEGLTGTETHPDQCGK